jgi:hypothetical protein
MSVLRRSDQESGEYQALWCSKPSYRDFEIHRFSDEEGAQEGARVVSRIERAIPAEKRHFADLNCSTQGVGGI